MRAILFTALLLAVVTGCGKKPDAAVAPAQDDPQTPPIPGEPQPRRPRQPVKEVDPKPLPEEAVKAWKEAGAYSGWLGLTGTEILGLRSELAEVRDAVPGFRFNFQTYNSPLAAKITLPQVPAINTPFGLSFHSVRAWDDKQMAQLAAFKSLSSLNLQGTSVSDAGLKHLAALKGLEFLNLTGTQVGNAGVKELAGLTNLKYLDLTYIVTDGGLKELADLTNLKYLTVRLTSVTDAGLAHLTGLENLECLDLAYTKVKDAGLKHLVGLSELKKLNLEGTKVTDAGVAELQKALPDCKITR